MVHSTNRQRLESMRGCIKRMFRRGVLACVVATGEGDVGRSLRRMDVDRNRVLVLHVNIASRNPQLMAVPTPVPIAMATATDADSRRDTSGRYWSGLMDHCASPCNFRSSHNVSVGGAVPEIAWFYANSYEGGRESGNRQLHIVRDDEVGLA